METKDNQIVTETSVNDSRLSFGAYLKKTRIEKGLSLEDIMDYTRISKYVLQQIEEVNASKLPEAVYLKGFLKSYACRNRAAAAGAPAGRNGKTDDPGGPRASPGCERAGDRVQSR